MLIGAAFLVLVAATLRSAAARAAFRAKPAGDWVIDLSNLAVQGVAVPVVQVVVVVAGLAAVVPEWRGAVALPGWAGFGLNVVVVDYLYYWNHRLLHTSPAWPVHRVHHTVTHFDVLATSRNTLWTSFVILYVWVNGVALFLLADPTGFALGASVTAALDLWRHSEQHPPAVVARWLRPWLILPDDHARHHGASAPRGNYGANWKLWDRLHGTLLSDGPTEPLGLPPRPLLPSLLWPF